MKPEAQYSGFIERFQSYSKEYSTLKDATYAALKDAILLNMFPSEITETEISALLHISRTPIREAMLQLSNDGLLEINHGRKAKIRSLTEKDITDLAIVLDSIHHLALMLCIDQRGPQRYGGNHCSHQFLYKAQRLPPSSQIQLSFPFPNCPCKREYLALRHHGSPSVVHLCFSRICYFPSKPHGCCLRRACRHFPGNLQP